MDDDPLDLVGDVLGDHFRIEAFAGEGLLSVVYRGRHAEVDANVAVKCLSLPTTLDGELAKPIIETFQEGCRLHYELARGNLNIAQTLASGSTIAPRTGATVPYLVREWFEGESLAADLARRRPSREQDEAGVPFYVPDPIPPRRSLAEALTMLEHVADGLSYAHDRGICHLALRPSNVFLAVAEGARRSKILDFGLGRALDQANERLPTPRTQILYPHYAAPEQLVRTLGDPGPPSDVYALALLLLEILSDRPVIDEPDVQKAVLKVLDRDVRPTPEGQGVALPSAVDKVLVQALSLDPANRQPNARALWSALREAEVGEGLRIRPTLANPRRSKSLNERLRTFRRRDALPHEPAPRSQPTPSDAPSEAFSESEEGTAKVTVMSIPPAAIEMDFEPAKVARTQPPGDLLVPSDPPRAEPLAAEAPTAKADPLDLDLGWSDPDETPDPAVAESNAPTGVDEPKTEAPPALAESTLAPGPLAAAPQPAPRGATPRLAEAAIKAPAPAPFVRPPLETAPPVPSPRDAESTPPELASLPPESPMKLVTVPPPPSLPPPTFDSLIPPPRLDSAVRQEDEITKNFRNGPPLPQAAEESVRKSVPPAFRSLFSVRRSDRPPPYRPRRWSSKPPPTHAPPPPALPRMDPASGPKLPVSHPPEDLARVEAQSNSPTIPAPPLLPDEARRRPEPDDGPPTFASLDGLDVSPITSDSGTLPKAPILPGSATDEPTVPVAAQVTKRAIQSLPTPLQSDFTRELAAEIRRQAEASALSDPAAPAPKPITTAEPTQKRVQAPEARRWPIVAGVAACVLVGLGAVGFIQRVGASKPDPSPLGGPSHAAPTTAPIPSVKPHPPEPHVTASAPVDAPPPSTPAGSAPRYQPRNARAALDRVAQDLPSCRTEKKGLWGTGGATVKFTHDGKVSDVTLGPPYRTAKEGQCVAGILRRADMGPFEGKAVPLSYEFFLPFALPK